jgi:hypothetical protein
VGFGGLGPAAGVLWPNCLLSRVAHINSRAIVVHCFVYSPLVWLVCCAGTVFPPWKYSRSEVGLPLVACFVASTVGVIL